MDNNENLYLVTPPPHIRADRTTRGIMTNVLAALLPVVVAASYFFGVRAFYLVLASVAASVAFEYLFCIVTRKMNTVTDLSAVVTGVMLALILPVTTPIWMLLLGDFFAIVIVKQLFGGIGQNIVNPALGARIFLSISFHSAVSTYIAPVRSFSENIDISQIVSRATPLVYLKSKSAPTRSIFEMALGNMGGAIGETSAVIILISGIYLILKRIIHWQTPVSFIGTVAVLSLIRGLSPLFMLRQILSGGLMFAAVFMATDYATTPVTNKGRLIFGTGCGILTCFIRFFGVNAEGVGFAIVTMNLLVWLIDSLTVKKCKKESVTNE